MDVSILVKTKEAVRPLLALERGGERLFFYWTYNREFCDVALNMGSSTSISLIFVSLYKKLPCISDSR